MPEITCELLINIVVSVVTGLGTGAVVSWFFYAVGRADTVALYRASQIDEVLTKFHHLAPCRRHSVRGQDGMDDTIHWMMCHAALMTRTGFRLGGETLLSIVAEMESFCPAGQKEDTRSAEEGAKAKAAWQKRMMAIRPFGPKE